jgi:single-strand DNA-binding protein
MVKEEKTKWIYQLQNSSFYHRHLFTFKNTVMTIIGRLTRDSVVNTLKDDRKVVNFSIAVNDSYQPKGGERKQITTYYNCGYWISDRIAALLKKGALVEVSGRISVSVYGDSDAPKASLNCHVNNIKIHAWPKDGERKETVIETQTAATGGDDDLPF